MTQAYDFHIYFFNILRGVRLQLSIYPGHYLSHVDSTLSSYQQIKARYHVLQFALYIYSSYRFIFTAFTLVYSHKFGDVSTALYDAEHYLYQFSHVHGTIIAFCNEQQINRNDGSGIASKNSEIHNHAYLTKCFSRYWIHPYKITEHSWQLSVTFGVITA